MDKTQYNPRRSSKKSNWNWMPIWWERSVEVCQRRQGHMFRYKIIWFTRTMAPISTHCISNWTVTSIRAVAQMCSTNRVRPWTLRRCVCPCIARSIMRLSMMTLQRRMCRWLNFSLLQSKCISSCQILMLLWTLKCMIARLRVSMSTRWELRLLTSSWASKGSSYSLTRLWRARRTDEASSTIRTLGESRRRSVLLRQERWVVRAIWNAR